MKTNSYVVNIKDIESFQKCPLIYKNFSPKNKTNNIALIEKLLTRIFFVELKNNGTPPSIGSMKTYWGKILKEETDNGMELSKANNINMSLTQYYKYHVKNIKPFFDVVAVNFPARIEYSKGIFQDTIPVIFKSNDYGVVPLFYSSVGEKETRSNKHRFGCASFSIKTDIPVKKYANIKITDNPRSLSITFHPLLHGELNRAIDELKQIVDLISSGYSVPSTRECNNCDFLQYCRL